MNDQGLTKVTGPDDAAGPQAGDELLTPAGRPADPMNVAPDAPAGADGVVTENGTPADDPGQPARWHAEAGRKGARRVHQLVQRGLLYEREHGLKRGRQRRRQLIEEGKLYEREHGLRPDGPGARPPRVGGDQLVVTFFRCLQRLAKPAYREKLARVLRALEDDAASPAGPRG